MRTLQDDSKFVDRGVVWSVTGVIPGAEEINIQPIIIADSGDKTIFTALDNITEWVEGGVIEEPLK